MVSWSDFNPFSPITTGYNYIKDQAGQGYETAAQGADAARQGYSDLANTQWGQAMQGLNQAQHAYDPSNLEWEKLYGRGPQAGATGDALTQYGRYLGDGPSNASTAYGNSQMALANQNAGADFYGQRGGALGNYSQSEQAYNQNQGAYGSPGAMEDFYRNAQQQLYGPGRTESLSYIPTNNLGNFASGLAGQQGVGDTTRGAGEIGGYYRDANDVSQYAAGQMGQLQGPGAYEQFVTSDINGTNPQLQRETTQGLASINQEMARRGAFNSGAADTQIGNFLGEQAAKDYSTRAQMAQSAQGMQLSRIGAGQSLSQASAQGKLAQGQAMQGLAGQTDAEKMGRLGQQLQAQQGASGEGLANSSQALNYAQAGDQQTLARMGMLGGFANQSEQDMLSRLAGGMGAAGQSDQAMLARLGLGFNMANTTDQSALAKQMGLYGMAQGADQGNLARYGMLGGLSGQMDANQLAQMGQMMGSRFGLDQGTSGNIANFYGAGMGAYGQDMSGGLNALANYYQLLGQGQNAENAVPWQFANLAAQGYGASQGGRRG